MGNKEALLVVLEALKKDQRSEFAKHAFFEIMRLLPGVPNVPSAETFFELMRKNVPCGLDLAPIRNGKVLLTYRDDQFFKGWHFLGSYREPRTDILADCQRAAAKEIGKDIRITNVQIIDFQDRVYNERFHDIGMLVKCEFEGEPNDGKWFSEMPLDLIDLHKPFWPALAQHL